MDAFAHDLPVTFLHHTSLPAKESYTHDRSYDILYILSGSCRIDYNGSENLYTADNICILPPDVSYCVSAVSAGDCLHIGIQSAFVFRNMPDGVTLCCDSVREPENDYFELKRIVSSISARYLESAAKNRLILHGLFFRFLAILEERYMLPPVSSQVPVKYQERIRVISEYLDRHFRESVTLSDLAGELYLTPEYLSRFFKKYLHKNFKDCLTEKRLQHARRELCFTENSITEIALHNGFSNPAALSSTFHMHYHMSPTDYRTKIKRAKSEQEYSLEKTARAELPVFPDASAENAFLARHIEASVLDSHAFRSDFCEMINAGFIHNLLSQDFQQDLAAAKEELGIRFIRVQGAVSSSFIPKVLPKYEYYFHNLDAVLAVLYKLELVPVFELSKLPYSYDSFPDAGFPFLSRGNRFFELLEALLKHCSAHYPEEWTSKWCFELWMNPRDTAKTYVADFRRIQSLIGHYLPQALTGGFGFSSGFDPDYLDKLFCELKEYGFSPSFLSAHLSFQVLTDQNRFHISSDPMLLAGESRLALEILRRYYPETPVYLTEWTSVFLSDLPVHYSCYQAAFICHGALSLRDCYDLMGYWILEESLSVPLMQNKTPSFWGYGLLDRSHLKMPAYHAFAMLKQLGTEEISRGQNYIITKKEENHYQILAFHYTHFISGNTFQNSRNASFTDVYQLFETSAAQRVEFSLKQIQSGTWQITRQFLNKANGSILDIWIGEFLNGNIDETEFLMKILLPTPDKEQYYRNSCVPETRTIFLSVTDTLKLTSELLPHNVCFWDIIRLY